MPRGLIIDRMEISKGRDGFILERRCESSVAIQTLRRPPLNCFARLAMTKFIRRVFLFFALWPAFMMASACTGEAEQRAIVVHGQGRPALWQVTGTQGNKAYIFGTVHLLPPDIRWQTPTIGKAIRQSDSLVTEVAGLDNKAAISEIFAQMGISSGLPPIAKRIPSAPVGATKAILEGIDIHADRLQKMESWAAAVTIAGAASAGLGMETSSGVESILQTIFHAAGKPHAGLETAAQQFGYFDRLPEADQRLLLAAALRSARNARAETKKILDHWMDGRADALLSGAATGALASPKLRESLLDTRNQNWARQMSVLIDQGRRPFVAVGAAHVAGSSGLPALMAAKGYKVERIQ